VKKLFIALGIAACAYLVVGWIARDRDAPAKLLVDRIWLDHLPRGETDPVQIFLVLDEEPLGLFQRASRWKGESELFRYRVTEGRLSIVYPQTREREEVRYRAGRCDREDFDYCLELRGASRGTKRYVSKKGWEIGQLDQLDARLPRLR
jgi:hypothetical protein